MEWFNSLPSFFRAVILGLGGLFLIGLIVVVSIYAGARIRQSLGWITVSGAGIKRLFSKLGSTLAFIVGYSLLLFLMNEIQPAWFTTWKSIGNLFWWTPVVLLVCILLVQHGKSWGKVFSAAILTMLVLSYWGNRGTFNIPDFPSTARAATAKTYSTVDPREPLKLSLEYGVWSDPVSIPEGESLIGTLDEPDGTIYFVKINEIGGRPGVVYKVTRKAGGDVVEKVVKSDEGEALKPVTRFESKNEIMSFMSGEPGRRLTMKIRFKPI